MIRRIQPPAYPTRPGGARLLAALLFMSVSIASEVAAQPVDDLWIDGRVAPGDSARAPLRASSLADLADSLSPSVVNVIVRYLPSPRARRGGDPSLGQGTGFIIHPSGYILTNNHVVEDAHDIRVRLLDKTEYPARVVGLDPQTDVALMKVTADGPLPAMPLGDSDAVRVGEYVLAIGNPLGLSHTVTTGIISALGRRDLTVQGETLYADFIQTDASINPGNSGGPLIGLDGAVVGMNTAINQRGQGIGFAIPINMVKALLPQLRDTGYVVRSWLGVRVQALDKNLARTFGLDEARGALVTEVVEGGPAARGGVEPGDVVLAFGEAPVRHSDQLPWLASTAGPGKVVSLDVLRARERRSLDVTMARLPEQDTPALPRARSAPEQTSSPGISVSQVTEPLARQLGVEPGEGVVVSDVAPNSRAAAAGLRERDVITRANARDIRRPADFDAVLQAAAPGALLRLKLMRGGRVVFAALVR